MTGARLAAVASTTRSNDWVATAPRPSGAVTGTWWVPTCPAAGVQGTTPVVAWIVMLAGAADSAKVSEVPSASWARTAYRYGLLTVAGPGGCETITGVVLGDAAVTWKARSAEPPLPSLTRTTTSCAPTWAAFG